MSRELMCQYGNCQETMQSGKGFKVTVTVSFDGTVDDRPCFCCYEHAALWLQGRDRAHNGLRLPAEVGR